MAELERMLNTIPQAALVLSLGRATVYELIRANELRVVKIGRASRITTADLEAFIERRLEASSREQS